MLFSSGEFLFIFLPAVMLLYNIPVAKNSVTYKNCILFIGSIFFYAWGEPFFVFLMLVMIVADWLMAFRIEKGKSTGAGKRWLATAVAMHVLVLFVFKYISFLSRQIQIVLNTRTLDIALPVGISFFTFQMMSYIFDVYSGRINSQKSLLKLGVYIAMFPQLVAGPIVRYSAVEGELSSRKASSEEIYRGIVRFIKGLSKKVLIADSLAVIADGIFKVQANDEISILIAWAGAIAYMLEIYYDFSGYSDMAIGMAGCFGFHFSENFNYPYMAATITEFWKRWHISLTDWFRDYVYIPLGGNRVSAGRHVFNLAVVWLLTGIWHGANWTFLLWGIIYFALQVLEKFFGKCYEKVVPVWLRRFITMLIVCLCWVLFKADSISLAGSYISCMFGKAGMFAADGDIGYVGQCMVLFVAAVVFSLPVGNMLSPFAERMKNVRNKDGNVEKIGCLAYHFGLILLILLCFMKIIDGSYSPFIYYNF